MMEEMDVTPDNDHFELLIQSVKTKQQVILKRFLDITKMHTQENTTEDQKDQLANRLSRVIYRIPNWAKTCEEQQKEEDTLKKEKPTAIQAEEKEEDDLEVQIQNIASSIAHALQEEHELAETLMKTEDEQKMVDSYLVSIQEVLDQNVKLFEKLQRAFRSLQNVEIPQLESEIEEIHLAKSLHGEALINRCREMKDEMKRLLQLESTSIIISVLKEAKIEAMKQGIAKFTKEIEIIQLKKETIERENSKRMEKDEKVIRTLHSTATIVEEAFKDFKHFKR